MIVGPILLLISSAITTLGGDDQAEYLAEVATRRGAEEASAVVGIPGFALLIPGVIGALNLLRHRGVVLGHIGGALLVVALPCFCGLLVGSFVDVAATAPGADTEAWAAISETLDDQAGAIVIVALALLGSLIGFLLLGIAFIRARTVPLYAPILIIVGIIVVGPISGDSRIVSIIGSALLLGGMGTIGLTLLRQSDEEWDRPGLGTGAAAPPERPAA